MDPQLRQRCDERLGRLHGAAARRVLVHGLVAWCCLAGAVVLAQLAILGFAEPSRTVRLGLLASGLALLAIGGAALVWRPLHALRRRADLARRLDRAGAYADTLAAAEEALRRPDRWRTDTPVRAALVDRLLARAARLLDELPLWRLLPVPRPGLAFAGLAVVLGLAGWFALVQPEALDRGLRRLGRPWSQAAPPGSGTLRLAPAPGHVIAGSNLAVAALDLVGGTEPVVCEVRAGTGLWRPLAARPVPQPGADPLLGSPYRRWEAILEDLREDFVYRFRGGARVSAEQAVAVWHPPLIVDLAARVTPPAYTGLPAQEVSRLPAYLEAPAGSRLALRGRASRPLRAASAVMVDADTVALTVGADTLGGEFRLDAPRSFRLLIADERGLAGRSELVYETVVIPDRVPVARLVRPEDDGRLPLSAPVFLQAAAEDDYGLAGVDLLLRRGDPDGGAWSADLPTSRGELAVDDAGWERLPLAGGGAAPAPGRRDATTSLGPLRLVVRPHEAADRAGLRFDVELAAGDLALVPGDVLEFVLEARDNRRPGPAGVGRSAVLRLQVASSVELLEARDAHETERRGDLAEMRRRTESLSADLERLRRELLKDPTPDWDRRQELQAAVERQRELQAELSRVAEAMQQDLEVLAENRLTSPEIMEKMDRIAELMREARSDAMQEMLAKLRETLEQMSVKDLALSMEELNRNQVEMLRRLDAAMDMLRDLAREQEMEGLTELVAELIAKQQDLTEATREEAAGREEGTEREDAADRGDEASPAADPEELARRQEALRRELEALAKRLEETLDALAEQRNGQEQDPSAAEQEMREALEQALAQLEQQQTSETMEQAGENLQQQRSQEASQQMQQALNDLAGLYHVLLRSQMAMQMAMQAEQAGQMRDLAADLLTLSERQERLGLDLPLTLRDVRADQLARRQHEILQGAIAVREGLQNVAGAAPREILRMLNRLDELIAGMGRALDQLEDGRAVNARQASGQSLAEMNRLVIDLLTQAQMTGQGGGSCQMRPMLGQQLQQMVQEQSGLNALAEQLRQQQGRLSQELRAGMQRLQEGQQGLAGRARQLAEEQRLQEQQDGGRLLGDLDELARDMERVGDDLGGGLVTEETLRRQDRILSRLLDMHNASRERDWARRRESRTADEVFADQEGLEGDDLDALAGEVRRWRPVEEAPPAYRDLVRDYFREIQRLHESAGRRADGQREATGGEP